MEDETLDKRRAIILFLKDLFEKYTDINHPLTQNEILELLYTKYGLAVERRTVGRDLDVLIAGGMDIVKGKRGSYLNSRDFDDTELNLLIESVLSSKYINKNHSDKLIHKLSLLSNVYFTPMVSKTSAYTKMSKSENQNLFLNMEIIKEAIDKGVQISFDFYKYGIDKKLYKSSSQVVSPIETLLHNQRYYLIGINEKYKTISFYRIDHIKRMSILSKKPATDIKTIEGYENGVDFTSLVNTPYMYSDFPCEIEFTAKEGIIDQLMDWFGSSVEMRQDKELEDTIHCKVKCSPKAMEVWAMQYLNNVEIIKPISLREKILDNINQAVKKYQK